MSSSKCIARNSCESSIPGRIDRFEAYSSTCPHLGCRVHWESEEGNFFCPCHRGVFDERGVGVSGPPADAVVVITGVVAFLGFLLLTVWEAFAA